MFEECNKASGTFNPTKTNIMKAILKISGVIATVAFMACNSNTKTDASNDSTATDSMATASSSTSSVVPGSYVDLSSGQQIEVVADPQTGYAINNETRAPLEFYVNTSTGDTLYRTGIIVNNAIVKDGSTWKLNEDMIERDGDSIKIKNDDGDIKMKNKTTDTKVKVEADGDAKIKTPESKTKVGEDGEVETKDRE